MYCTVAFTSRRNIPQLWLVGVKRKPTNQRSNATGSAWTSCTTATNVEPLGVDRENGSEMHPGHRLGRPRVCVRPSQLHNGCSQPRAGDA
jgi:hypothetical protein